MGNNNDRRADLAPMVKPLEWEESWAYGLNLWTAGGYEISYSKAQGWWLKGGELVAFSPENLEAAKAAAQADYERRIMSALDMAPVSTNKLSELFAVMQDCARAYLEPTTYTRRRPGGTCKYDTEFDMPSRNHAKETKAHILGRRKEAFVADMIYFLDGPEQREAQASVAPITPAQAAIDALVEAAWQHIEAYPAIEDSDQLAKREALEAALTAIAEEGE